MGKLAIGLLAGAMLLAAASPSAAQTRPRVSGSESSVASGPTCVIGGVVSDCAGSAASGIGPSIPGPVIVGSVAVPVQVQAVSPIPGVGFGGSWGGNGDVSNDVDVNRSTRSGTAAAR
jgi:hypothetical protein